MSSYFVLNDWKRHNDVVYEAKKFVEDTECDQLIEYINSKDSSCHHHDHAEHTPGNDPNADFFMWKPVCFDQPEKFLSERKNTSFDIVEKLVHQMHDAANRYTMSDMRLAKVIVHKYGPGSSGPEHTDIFPLATLAYLNDDYEGGEIYFSNTGLSLKPGRGSVLAFDGGGVNKHGVSKISGVSSRYVIVAFWEYAHDEKLFEFWSRESEPEDKLSDEVSEMIKRKGGNEPDREIAYAEVFPILKIHNFITKDFANKIIEYLHKNDIDGDECWGPSCFREYYLKAYNEEPSPDLVEGITLDTLPNLNKQIGEEVSRFMEVDPGDLVFSKFKGHDHREGSMSPPHTHGPAEAVAELFLDSEFKGGKIVIPQYGIEIEPEPYTLYIYSEAQDLSHGVSKVTEGFRPSLVSHWQAASHPYNNAGANV